MKRTMIYAGLAFALVLISFGCEKTDEVTNPDGAFPSTDGTPESPDSLALARTFPPLLANGVDQITIRATVVNGQGKGLSGVGVVFSTSQGVIDPFATTDASGIASTTLTSEASATDITAVVTASAASANLALARPPADARVLISRLPLPSGLVQGVLGSARSASERGIRQGEVAPLASIQDLASILMRGVTMTLEANPATIPADGISQSRVTARLVETTRGIPISGEEVRFGATRGTISGRVVADGSGAAVALLAAAPGQTGSEITAYYGNLLTAHTGVQFSPLTLLLETSGPSLIADGRSSLLVIAHLANQEGNPVPGARIDFSTSAGTITSPITTGADGTAASTLVSASAPGTAEIRAAFSANLTRTVSVPFLNPPPVATLILEIDPTALPADGASVAHLRARALDASSNPAPDGSQVQFSIASGSGRIVAPVATTEGGVAEAEYVAGTQVGVEQIQATAGTAATSGSITLTPLNAGNLSLGADGTDILADGMASVVIRASVTDFLGHPIAPGTLVNFTTTLGTLEEITPTNSSGEATVRVRAERFRTGIGRVTASVQGMQRTLDVHFVSEDAAHLEAIRVDPPRIGIRGAADRETATITFEVRDRNGIPVDSDHASALTFSLRPSGQATDATIYPATATTNEQGRVAATVNAGIMAGAVEVHASSAVLLSQPVRVVIHGDLPDPDHFTLFFDRVNVAGLVHAGLVHCVTAKVADQYGNPVPESTAVWFRAEHGIVQGSGFTGTQCSFCDRPETDPDLGDATVCAESGEPYPAIPGGTGLNTICAQTVSKSGGRLEKCADILWSGPTVVEITDPVTTFNVPNGGFVSLTYRVRDANFNPLTGGTRINVSTTGGRLGGETDVTLPDTQSRDYTTFQVVLSDADPTRTQPEAVTITVRVTSENGNRSALITGTVN